MTSPYDFYGGGSGGGGGAVSSVAGKTGAVTLVAADAGAVPTYATASHTANFTATVAIFHLVDTTGGAVTATLPAASTAGQQVAIKLNAGTTAVTVVPDGTDTIGAAATTASITLLAEVWEFVSSGTGQWNLVAGNKSLTSLDGRYPQRANNLSDLASASTSRTNLGLGAAATLTVGTTAGTVAAGDDSRITGAAQLTGATFTGEVITTDLKVTGTTGAPNVGRFVGVTTSGAPTSGTYAVGDYCLSRDGQLFACTVAGTPGTWVTPADTRNLLVTGEETLPRDACASSAMVTSTGSLRLTYFTARKSETTTQVRTITGGTAAAATPTLCRLGLYTIDPSTGDGTLVASTASDTALWAATNTGYTKLWASSYAKVAGQRYALGWIIVTGAATPTFVGTPTAGSATFETSIAPRLCGVLTGQSDLPSTFTQASLTNTSQRMLGYILP